MTDDSTEPPVAGLLSPHSLLVLAARAGVALRLVRPILELLIEKVVLPRHSDELFHYEPKRSDVFVATFAKSGTNWAMQICLQIAHLGEVEFRHIHEWVAWPEVPYPEIVALDDPGPRAAAPTGMRVIKTHLPASSVPYDPAATYVTIIRDPKEVLVSAYYFLLGLLGVVDRVSPEQWFDIALQDDLFSSRWAEHTAGFWAWRDKPNVYVRTFAELRSDHRGAVRAIASLMGVELTREEFERVVERSTFAWMKAHDGAFAPVRSVLVSSTAHPSMMRRGVSGGASELVDDELATQIDAACRRALVRLGSDFPYDEAFAPGLGAGGFASTQAP